MTQDEAYRLLVEAVGKIHDAGFTLWVDGGDLDLHRDNRTEDYVGTICRVEVY